MYLFIWEVEEKKESKLILSTGPFSKMPQWVELGHQKLNPVFPFGCQEPNYLRHHHCLWESALAGSRNREPLNNYKSCLYVFPQKVNAWETAGLAHPTALDQDEK